MAQQPRAERCPGRLLGCKGKGITGSVFLMQQHDNPELVAVKIFPKEEEKRARSEISMLKRLSHPNVVEYAGEQFFDGRYRMMMGHMDRTLFQELRSLEELSFGPIGFVGDKLVLLSRQLLAGCAYIHKEGIYHRDLKSDNILLDKDATILKIADFGHATTTNSERDIIKIYGAVCYRAPEFLQSEISGVTHSNARTYSPYAIDLWAIGCIFVEMATGRDLFCHPDESELSAARHLQCITHVLALPKVRSLRRMIREILGGKDIAAEVAQADDMRSANILGILGRCKRAFVEQLLCIDPSERRSAEECLSHTWLNQ